MRANNEFDNLIERLRPEASLPTLRFEDSLRKKILRKNNEGLFRKMKNSVYQMLFGSEGIPLNNFGVLTLGVLLTAVLMSSLFIWKLNQNNTYIEQTDELSAEESYAVLSSVYKNNPSAMLNVTAQTELLTELIQDGNIGNPAILNSALLMQPASQGVSLNKDYNFFHVTFTSTLGPKASECSKIATDNTVVDTFTYEDEAADAGANSYFKSIIGNADGTIHSISITDNSATLLYQGGSYAVRIPNFTPATDNQAIMPGIAAITDNTTDTGTTPSLEDIFKAKTTNVAKAAEASHNYYDVTLIKNISATDICSAGVSDEQRQLIIVYRIDPDKDYHIISTTYYLDTVSPESIILQTTNKYEKALLDKDTALSTYFSLPEGLPVIDIKAPEGTPVPASMAEKIISGLTENAIPVLLLKNYQNTLTGFHSNIDLINSIGDGSNYLTDPAFYSEENWQVFQNNQAISLAHQTFVTYQQLAADGVTTAKISVLKELKTTTFSCNSSEAVTVKVAGEDVPATVCYDTDTTLHFKYAGWIYEVSMNGIEGSSKEDYVFTLQNSGLDKLILPVID